MIKANTMKLQPMQKNGKLRGVFLNVDMAISRTA